LFRVLLVRVAAARVRVVLLVRVAAAELLEQGVLVFVPVPHALWREALGAVVRLGNGVGRIALVVVVVVNRPSRKGGRG
jgi:hypothetical protein